MERMVSKERTGMGILVPQRRVIIKNTPDIEIRIPGRGRTGPVRIGKLMEPIIQIINHPDRSRLMAELFKDYK